MVTTKACRDNLETVIDTLRKCAEECEYLDDFMAYSEAMYYLVLIKEKGMVMVNGSD